MKVAITAIFFLSFMMICLTILSHTVYGVSPTLRNTQLNNEKQNFINYGPNNGFNDTRNYLEQNIDLDRVYVKSNGTHLEIKFLFNNFLERLKDVLLKNSTVPQNLFINIFVDSDDDETTGFLGYGYRYLLINNASEVSNDNDNTTVSPVTTKRSSPNSIQKYLNHTDILEGNELDEVITRTLNSKEIIEKLNWVIRGYELLDYDFQPLFYTSKLTQKQLSVIPDGFKVTLDLAQIGYPSNFAVLVDIGRKSEDYKLSHTFGKIHLPRPNLNLEDNSINIANGKNSVALEFNNSGLYNLNVKADLLKKDISNDDLSINFSQGKQFEILDGKGSLPVNIIAGSNFDQKHLIIPVNLSYSVLGEYDFADVNFNNSLTAEHIYNKIVYLNLIFNDERNRLINFAEIPSQYIAVILGAIFTFFIPTIARTTKEYFQKRTANKYLKEILKEQNSDNPDASIKNLITKVRIIKHDFIRGKITKDQYEILKENVSDVIKDLVSKKN
ncbi:MAG TPA: hypothetical protein VFK40_11650 [Nitrososphaeraceae archaeon]|nr:hypothetical protein [Nitrososphaeraceae archaeon]